MSNFPGQEAKTISMALAVASHDGATLNEIYEEAGRALEIAKTLGKDCFLLLGRTLEWKHMAEASELKDRMARRDELRAQAVFDESVAHAGILS